MQNVGIMQKSWLTVFLMFIKSFLRVSIDATNVIGDGVSMAERAVRAAKHRQLIDVTIATKNYRKDALAVAGLQRLKTHDAITDYIKDDPTRKQFFDNECKELDAELTSEFAKLAADDAQD